MEEKEEEKNESGLYDLLVQIAIRVAKKRKEEEQQDQEERE